MTTLNLLTVQLLLTSSRLYTKTRRFTHIHATKSNWDYFVAIWLTESSIARKSAIISNVTTNGLLLGRYSTQMHSISIISNNGFTKKHRRISRKISHISIRRSSDSDSWIYLHNDDLRYGNGYIFKSSFKNQQVCVVRLSILFPCLKIIEMQGSK